MSIFASTPFTKGIVALDCLSDACIMSIPSYRISHCLAVFLTSEDHSHAHVDALPNSADERKAPLSCRDQAKRFVTRHKLVGLFHAPVFACSNLDLEMWGFSSFSQSLSASFSIDKLSEPLGRQQIRQ